MWGPDLASKQYWHDHPPLHKQPSMSPYSTGCMRVKKYEALLLKLVATQVDSVFSSFGRKMAASTTNGSRSFRAVISTLLCVLVCTLTALVLGGFVDEGLPPCRDAVSSLQSCRGLQLLLTASVPYICLSCIAAASPWQSCCGLSLQSLQKHPCLHRTSLSLQSRGCAKNKLLPKASS